MQNSEAFTFKSVLPDDGGTYLAIWPGEAKPRLTEILFYDGEMLIGRVNDELVSVHKMEAIELPRFLVSDEGEFVDFFSEETRQLIPGWATRVVCDVVHREYSEPGYGKNTEYICKHCGVNIGADLLLNRKLRSPCPLCNNRGGKMRHDPRTVVSKVGCPACGIELDVGRGIVLLHGEDRDPHIRVRCPACKETVDACYLKSER